MSEIEERIRERLTLLWITIPAGIGLALTLVVLSHHGS